MYEKYCRKSLIFGMIFLFTLSSLIPNISSIDNIGTSDEIDQQQDNYNASSCLLGTMLFA